LGKNLFGATLDPAIWQEVTGVILMIVSLVWTIKSKALTVEILQSVILKVVMVAGTIWVSSGSVSGDFLDKIVMAVTVVLPIVYSIIAKKKSTDIATGDIPLHKLSK